MTRISGGPGREPGEKPPLDSSADTASFGSDSRMNARQVPSGKNPPSKSRPEPRASMSANDAISGSGAAPSTSVAMRLSPGRGGAVSHGSRKCPKLRGADEGQGPLAKKGPPSRAVRV